MPMRKIAVIGGGASGLMAAATAAKNGARVVLIEKMHRPGRKLRITGKGRCNITNIASLDDFLSHFGKNGKFLRPSFNAFFSEDLTVLLSKLGVPIITERGGRVFPESGQAGDIVDALANWAKSFGVKTHTEATAMNLKAVDKHIKGLMISEKGKTTEKFIEADSVIIATGGKSYPATGSTGDGYELAAELGHTIVPVRPALVPLIANGKICSRLKELTLKNVNVKLYVNYKKKTEAFNEVMFTEAGLSGAAILAVSRHAVDALRNGQEVSVSIDLKPALDYKKLDGRLLRDIGNHGNRTYKTLLSGLLPKRLIPVFAELIGIPDDTSLSQFTVEQRKKLLDLLKDFRFEIIGHGDFNEAIITSGGINLREINPNTLESRLVQGLFFAGEVMDIDADTGGYNLQAAFSTGYLAGKSAAMSK